MSAGGSLFAWRVAVLIHLRLTAGEIGWAIGVRASDDDALNIERGLR